ncbi:MAG: hypothetical protein DA408_07760 [Bacteroidetes bacterium]|nr:MAG: hypothetical protein C7N36_03035 [Bacteroidota bacterium]PTM13144.1 MAG: hypothetical protein DA408_07760 [Bacteroidota bacterium]
MHYELSHDSIARQVYQKASTEARARRKVERFISERFQAYQERQAPLTQDDVDYVWPYLNVVNSKPEELAFIQEGKRKLLRSRRVRMLVLAATTLAFALLAFWAIGQRNQAETREQQSRSMRVSLAARYALYEGNPALAFRLAEQTLLWNNDASAQSIASDVLREIQANPLVRDVNHTDSITALQFSADGTFFLSAALDGEVRLSDLAGDTLHRFRHESGVVWAALLPGETALLSLTTEGALWRWDIQSQQKTPLARGLKITTARLAQDGTRLAGMASQEVYVWEPNQGTKPLFNLTHTAPVSAVDFLPAATGWDLVTATAAGTAFRWNAAGEQLLAYGNQLHQPVTGIHTSPKGDKVIFQTALGDFMLAGNGDSLMTQTPLLFRAFQPRQSAFALSTDPERIVSISNDSNLVYVWNLSSPQSDIDLQWSPRGKVRYATLSSNGKRLLAASTDNETVLHLLKATFTDQNQDLFRFSNQTAWGVFAPNQAHFLSSAGGNEALLWKLDPDYVNNKMGITQDQLLQYYQSRIRPLNANERKFYLLD